MAASSAAPASASASAPTTTTAAATTNNPDVAVAAKVDERRKKKPPAVRYPFWFGGSASSMAACVTHPLDLGKFCVHTMPSFAASAQDNLLTATRTLIVKVRTSHDHDGERAAHMRHAIACCARSQTKPRAIHPQPH